MPLPNALYDLGRQAFANGQINWLGDAIKIVLVHTGGGGGPVYTVNLQTDEFLIAIPVGARIATSTSLVNKTNARGVCGADNVLLPFVSVTNPIGAIVVYQDTGADATSRLIAYLSAAQGLPFTTPIADILVEWALVDVASVIKPRIFRL